MLRVLSVANAAYNSATFTTLADGKGGRDGDEHWRKWGENGEEKKMGIGKRPQKTNKNEERTKCDRRRRKQKKEQTKQNKARARTEKITPLYLRLYRTPYSGLSVSPLPKFRAPSSRAI